MTQTNKGSQIGATFNSAKPRIGKFSNIRNNIFTTVIHGQYAIDAVFEYAISLTAFAIDPHDMFTTKETIWFLLLPFSSYCNANTLRRANEITTQADPAATPPVISLHSRVSPKSSPFRRRDLSPVTLPLDDFFFSGTDLQWIGNITVGTPPQIVTVIFDTGSYGLELRSDRCSSCKQIKFNSSASSTFVDWNRSSNISFVTGSSVEPVTDVLNEWAMTLDSATDTVGLVGGFSAPSMNISLITEQTSKFDVEPFTGILGIGPISQGFFAALVKQGLPALFSMYLTPKSVGNAELTLGGIDSSKFTNAPIYTAIFPDPSSNLSLNWQASSHRISVNGHTSHILNASHIIMFDSGTANVILSTNLTEAIYALISPDIKPIPTERGAYGIACDRIADFPATIDLSFTSQNGTAFNLTIPSSELSVGPFADNSSHCQTFIDALDSEGVEFNIAGGSLLKHYYSIFDVGAQRMGFAPSIQVSSSSNNTGASGNTKSPSSSSLTADVKSIQVASGAVLMMLLLSLI